MSSNARWWGTKDSKIECRLCPRHCQLAEDQRGFCFVRENVGKEMQLSTYGKSTGFCIDPIEKKPLNHFLPGSAVLSFGTAGCNLGCKFCQNWDMSKSREIEILCEQASPQAIVQAAKNTGCRSIAFTYNDPIIWAEYAIDTAKAARAEGIKTVAVTSGYITDEARSEFFEYIDAANVDLKAFRNEFYKKLAWGKLQPVLDTLVWLKHSSKLWFEITNLVIPGENDSPDEIEEMCKWIVEQLGPDVPLHFSAFHPDYKMINTPRTPHKTLIRVREQALQAGINYVYLGNVLDNERQNTHCPNCKLLLIERDNYELGTYNLTESSCKQCSMQIPGLFEENKGTWGSKRRPIVIREEMGSGPNSGFYEKEEMGSGPNSGFYEKK